MFDNPTPAWNLLFANKNVIGDSRIKLSGNYDCLRSNEKMELILLGGPLVLVSTGNID